MTDELSPAFSHTLDEYKYGYMAARNLAERSRVDYETDQVQFLAFLQGLYIHDLIKVEAKHVTAYLAELDRQKLKGSSRRRKLTVIRTFFAWLKEAGDISHDPTLHIKPPQGGDKEPRVLTKDEYERVLAQVQQPRDRAIIQLVLQTGVRLSELYQLNLYDLKLPKRITSEAIGEVRIIGKGSKERTLILNTKACEALKTWLKVRPQVDTNAVFVSNRNQRLSKRQIQNIVDKYMEAAEITDAGVHSLRHTFATHHVAQGTDIVTVHEVLGHESLDTTKIYITLAKKQQAYYLQKNAL